MNFKQDEVIFKNVTVRPQIGALTPPGLYTYDLGLKRPDGEIIFDFFIHSRVFYPKRG